MSDASMRAPLWFWAVIVAMVFPAIWLGGAFGKLSTDNSDLFAWLYPIYMIGAGACALACYAERRTLAWILVAVMVLSNAGMFAVICLL